MAEMIDTPLEPLTMDDKIAYIICTLLDRGHDVDITISPRVAEDRRIVCTCAHRRVDLDRLYARLQADTTYTETLFEEAMGFE